MIFLRITHPDVMKSVLPAEENGIWKIHLGSATIKLVNERFHVVGVLPETVVPTLQCFLRTCATR